MFGAGDISAAAQFQYINLSCGAGAFVDTAGDGAEFLGGTQTWCERQFGGADTQGFDDRDVGVR